MTKLNKRRGHQAYKILPIIKAVETAILITITIYKAIKWAIEEIRTQTVSSQTNGPEEADQRRLK